MNRRRFLHLLTMAASAVAVSPYWTPTPELVEPPPPPAVTFDPSAFTLFDQQTGVSIRFIQNWNDRQINRLDVIYGWSTFPQPEMAIRVSSEGTGARARRRLKRLRLAQPLTLHPIADTFVLKGITV